ncbi:hypothetical protein [Mesorhizobium ventifaucium]|uniref:Uncharacterized protein n=1 Tax=Mesorhizobium ventifaucium TaxID=666020 RepID=A0ABN8JXM6_9HYPH|nr:hypothetical protein [Mesorhizobium ventifaucium]CAH2402775.1 hypothetical protein MES4922_300045 [Mesorhizobium ventifaucium]
MVPWTDQRAVAVDRLKSPELALDAISHVSSPVAFRGSPVLGELIAWIGFFIVASGALGLHQESRCPEDTQ